MNERAQRHLEILGQLASEYEQKHRELEEVMRNSQHDAVASQLKFYSQRTTDRFRAAQAALFQLMGQETDEAQEQTLGAATTLCRCFDEMRILFEIFLEYSSETGR